MIGTHHFNSMFAAIRYYAQYGYKREDVQAKLSRGEITIGEPRQADGKPYPVCVADCDGRYHIETK